MTTTVLDRIVRWHLDFDGDMYGADERDRLRWYEAMTVAASVQWTAVPWAAAVLVWVLGEPAVLPLSVMMAVLAVPMVLTTFYLHHRQVDTDPRSWTRKRIVLAVLGTAPWVLFFVGAAYHAAGPSSTVWQSTAVGGVLGGVAGVIASAIRARRRRMLEDSLVEDDE
ncbi:hypothetical protein Ait01nite_002030 [Actinoplanes italicus]|uniref:DUF2029 domain-containing protein n=1 Tax=Actinoplanes italicus TaxID=113567 RepID=A0A2T0KDU3_9ACTN|nr:hypothetical protein [Actinoplanes italicus]PRX21478.1 hypothetical protein CLV67_106258 [Actinoplanes italicus]GIE27158.1 hypothetical protein Ait01nite_002030 [Actinoplanes italicus]